MVIDHDPRGHILQEGTLGSFLLYCANDSIQSNSETCKDIYFWPGDLSINSG